MFEARPASRLFLDSHGWAGVDPVPLAGDASFRHYFRLTDGKRRAVLMDAPPPREDVRPFAAVAAHLAALGLSAPRVIAKDTHGGFLLLEDLGDETYTRALAAGADEASLYALATDTLIALHRHPAQRKVDVPAYDDAVLDREASLLVDWFLPAWRGAATPDGIVRDYLAAWRRVYPHARVGSPVLVLRDYHVDNLVRLPGRGGIAACGLLDFQDALIGSRAYDLASLVEDARRDVDPAVARSCVERYLAAFPDVPPDAFRTAMTVLAAQRNAKIVGIFVRLARRDGKPQYLKHIPRVWRLLAGNLAHPALAELRDWFDEHVPAAWRTAPEFEDAR
ncbi:MAG: phosphotransferase [Rhodospirillales bacterium]|nr:phosphotransferase [Rhodospirillales bacterium]